MRFLIPLIFTFSFLFSQNNGVTKESFLSKIYELKTEDQFVSYFELSYKNEIVSLFSKEDLFVNRIILLNKLINGNFKNKTQYLEFTIDYFLKNKDLIDFEKVSTWSTLTDIMYHINKNKIYREDLKELFNLLFEIGDYVREIKIAKSEGEIGSFDIELSILSYGLANYYDLIENKELAVSNYKIALDYLDTEKYYELFKFSFWECLSKLFFLNLELSFAGDINKKKTYLKEAEESLLWINSINLSNEKYKGAELIKNNANRSFAFRVKDYEKERIFIDKLSANSGKDFDISIMDISNKYNLNLISEEDYGEELVSLFDTWGKPYDARVIGHLNGEKEYQAWLKLFLSRFGGLTYYNKLSYNEQISQFKYRFKDFMILKGSFVRMNEALKKTNLESFVKFIIKLKNYSVNNKELFEKSEYNQITELFNEKKNFAEFIDYYSINKSEMSPTNKILNLEKYRDKIKLLEQNIKKDFVFSEIYLKNIQDELLNDQAIVRIVQNYNGEFMDYYSLIITENTLDFIKLNDDVDFEKIYNYYLNNLNSKGNDSFTYRYLFKKIHEKLEGIKDVFFINKGVYANINLESIKSNSGEFLFDLLNIRYVSDLLSSIGDNSKIINIKNSLLVGDPIFDINNKKSTTKKPTRSGLYQLPSTRIEVESINKILKENNINTISFLGEDATELNFKNNLKKDLIHIATHGFYKIEDDFPRFGLFFANSGNSNLIKENGEPLFNDKDNILRETELKYLNLSETELLVLSACETAVSYSLMIGNYNLSEEFIRSGVKNVISTIWKVDDMVTQKFMTIFYEMLSKGNSINSSLKLTKLKIREDYSHPYYWAPFVLLSS